MQWKRYRALTQSAPEITNSQNLLFNFSDQLRVHRTEQPTQQLIYLATRFSLPRVYRFTLTDANNPFELKAKN